MKIDTSKLLEIIGSKEVEINLLRGRIAQLEQETQACNNPGNSKPLNSDPIDVDSD